MHCLKVQEPVGHAPAVCCKRQRTRRGLHVSRQLMSLDGSYAGILGKLMLWCRLTWGIGTALFGSIVALTLLGLVFLLVERSALFRYEALLWVFTPLVAIVQEEFAHTVIALRNGDGKIDGLRVESLTVGSIPLTPIRICVQFSGHWEPYVVVKVSLGGPFFQRDMLRVSGLCFRGDVS